MTGERERLPRLLALVPYLQAHTGIAIEEAAADFAIT
jgi:proteasome accessory factor C